MPKPASNTHVPTDWTLLLGTNRCFQVGSPSIFQESINFPDVSLNCSCIRRAHHSYMYYFIYALIENRFCSGVLKELVIHTDWLERTVDKPKIRSNEKQKSFPKTTPPNKKNCPGNLNGSTSGEMQTVTADFGYWTNRIGNKVFI